MAGRAKRRALVAELTKRAAEECEDGTAHLDYVILWTEGGGTLQSLIDDISKELGEEYHVRTLTRHLTDHWPEEYGRLIKVAREKGAWTLLEQSVQIVDDLNPLTADRDQIEIAKARSNVRAMLAEKWNRRELGAAKNEVQVNVSLNSLHLDALRARSTATAKLASGSNSVIAASDAPRAFLSSVISTQSEGESIEVIEAESAIDFAIVPDEEAANQLPLL